MLTGAADGSKDVENHGMHVDRGMDKPGKTGNLAGAVQVSIQDSNLQSMANKSFRWMNWVWAIVAIACLGGAWMWYSKNKSGSQPQYQLGEVTRGDLAQTVTASGQLNPLVNVQVGSQISGRIKAIYVDFNSRVQSNQVIAEIDASTYETAVLRAQAQLSNAVANLALARVQADRSASLFKANLIPASDHDTAMAQLQQAEANVVTARANLESAEVDLSRCTIYAPVDGVVISRNVDVGQTVAASFNTPTLFVIANDLSKMQIGALISEADIGGVGVGQDVNFTVDAYPYRSFHGKVTQIRYGPVTNQNVVNYSAMVDVDNEDLKLLPGMTATVQIIVAERENVLQIPYAALRFRPPEIATVARTNLLPQAMGAMRSGGGPGGRQGGNGGRGGIRGRGGRGGGDAERGTLRTVYVLKKDDKSGKPELKPVAIRTGITDGIQIEVLDGLTEGEQVVTGMIVEGASQANMPPASSPFGGGRRRGF